MRKHLTLISLILIVFVAGCTGNGDASTTSSTNGLVVKNVKTIDGYAAELGSTVGLSFIVENEGAAKAEHACAQVFGQGWVKRADYSSDVGAWYDLGDAADDACATGGTMNPKNQDGPSYVDAEFDISNLRNPVAESESQDLTIRVWSQYNTIGTAKLQVISTEYEAELRRQGSITRTPVQSTSTDGPVQIKIAVDEPVTATSTKTIPFRITFINVGGGLIFNPAEATGKVGYQGITSDDYGTVSYTVKADYGGETWTVTCPSTTTEVRDGPEGRTVSCSINAKNPSQPRGELTIVVDADYGYRTQYSAKVNILQSLNVEPGQSPTSSGSTDTPTESTSETSGDAPPAPPQ